jgi:hypothetical protein
LCVYFFRGELADEAFRDLLRKYRRPTDLKAVLRESAGGFHELIRSQAIRSALERSSDTLFVFALRAVERVISDHSRTNRETINQLWEVVGPGSQSAGRDDCVAGHVDGVSGLGLRLAGR